MGVRLFEDDIHIGRKDTRIHEIGISRNRFTLHLFFSII